jgi:NADPH-dependent 2,4-dienoyl-CoA reductase/sulfur reductase-like enzyme
MIKEVELVVVGAGPAGIEAAITASESGADVTLIDSSPRPGGQFYQQVPKPFQTTSHDEHQTKGQQLFNRLNSSNVRVLNNTLVWGIFEGIQPRTWYLTLHGSDAPNRLSARAVILATGAYDRSIPFPGWDLPGVITAGATLRMLKNQRVLPGKRFVLSGTGPLQLQTAAYLIQAGAEVIAVCESSTSLLWCSIPYLPSVWGQWGRIKEGANFLKTLFQAQVPYRFGWTITSAHGEDRVNKVAIQKLGKNNRPISQPEIIQDVDTVVVGFGLTPQTELCRLLGCTLEYQEQRGGFVPRRNERMQTSCPGIYAVGDGAGIGGAENAVIEGRIAGYAVSAELGRIEEITAQQMISRKKKSIRREQRFARMLGSLFSPSPGLFTLAGEDTIICRCEQVTLGEIQEAIVFGAQSVNDIKSIARTGMGNCQGRTCGSILAQILAAETGKSMEEGRYLNIRPPIHPIPLHAIEEYGEDSDQSDRGDN